MVPSLPKLQLVFFVVMEVSGSELRLWKVSRMDMGAYMCIAKNGVPPAVSKRIQLGIDCKLLFYRDFRIIEIKLSSGFRHFFTVAFDSLF